MNSVFPKTPKSVSTDFQLVTLSGRAKWDTSLYNKNIESRVNYYVQSDPKVST